SPSRPRPSSHETAGVPREPLPGRSGAGAQEAEGPAAKGGLSRPGILLAPGRRGLSHRADGKRLLGLRGASLLTGRVLAPSGKRDRGPRVQVGLPVTGSWYPDWGRIT